MNRNMSRVIHNNSTFNVPTGCSDSRITVLDSFFYRNNGIA